ncbi:MAG: M28 family peptidase [Sphingomonadaceae bacterium]
MRAWLETLVTLAIAALLAIMATTPPAPRKANSSPAPFDLARAEIDLRTIARAPHPTGSVENGHVRDYLLAGMKAIGMETATREGVLDEKAAKRLNKWSGRSDPPARTVNLIGVLPGRDRAGPAVLLMAHHDSVWGSPAASDDGAGVVTALEVARQVAAKGPPPRDLIVLLTDGEELGLQGAAQFFAGDPLQPRIGAVINMEARGGGGRASLFETTPGNGEAVAVYRNAATWPAASSLATFVYSVLPNDTDLSTAMAGRWAGYNFAFIGRPGLYHSPKATPEALDKGTLMDMGWQVSELTQALLSAPKLPGRTKDTVFFDLYGVEMVSYPAAWGWAMLALAAVALGVAANGQRDLRALGQGAGRVLGLMLLSAIVLYVLNRVSGAGAGANYYDRLAAIPLLEVMALLAAGACFLLVLGKGLAGPARQAGAAIPLLVIGLAMQAAAPTAAYVVVVPVLIAALVLAARVFLPANPAKAIAILLGGAVLGYMLSLGHQLMQGVGPDLPSVAALPLALGALALVPLWPALSHRHARQAGLALLVLALGVSLWVRFDPMADSVASYSLARR